MATLQDFLVSVRFQEVGGQATINRVKSIGKGILGVGTALVGMVMGAKKFEEKLATGLHDIHVSAKAVGVSTVSSFKAIKSAAEAAGVSSESVVSGLQSIHMLQRKMGSGANEYLKSLAPHITKLDDSVAISNKLFTSMQQDLNRSTDKAAAKSEWFWKLSSAVGEEAADAMLTAYENGGDLSKQFDEFKKANKPIDDATESSERFYKTIMKYNDTLESQISQKNIPMMEKANALLAETTKNIPEVAQKIVDESEKLENALSKLEKVFGPMFDKIVNFVDKHPEATFYLFISYLLGIPQLLMRMIPAMGSMFITGLTAVSSFLSTSALSLFSSIGILLKASLPAISLGIASMLGYELGSAIQKMFSTNFKVLLADTLGRLITSTAAYISRLAESVFGVKIFEDARNADELSSTRDLYGDNLKTNLKNAKKDLEELSFDKITKAAKDGIGEQYDEVKDSYEKQKKVVSDSLTSMQKDFSKAMDDMMKKTADLAASAGQAAMDSVISTASADEFSGNNSVPDIKMGKSAKERMKQAFDFFVSKGYSEIESAGIVANLKKESEFAGDVISGKRRGDGGRAYGIAQWHPDRQKNFQKVFGKPITESTYQEQLEFVDWELKHSHIKAGKKIAEAKTPRSAGAMGSKYYEGPKAVELEMRERGDYAEAIYREYSKNVTITNHVTVNGTKTNEQTAKVISDEMKKTGKSIAITNQSGLR